MKNQKTQVWLPLILSLAMIAGIFIGFKMRDGMSGRNFFALEKQTPVEEIMSLIKNKYVDEVNINSLADTAIEAMLHKLDPHSVYIPANELEDINDGINGSFYGIGIEFEIHKDTLNVIHVIKDGPGAKAGLITGDKIIKANDVSIAGKKIGTDSIRSLLRGNRGSKLEVDILRNSKILHMPITRNIISISSVDAFYMMDKSTGYIRIDKFSTQTYHDFMGALTALKKQGLQKLILDLRDNGGGVLDEAIEIADEFLDADKLITYTEGKHSPKKEFRCRRLGQFEKGKLVIMCNEGSASASEVLMGALQDWDRATIIGRRSFGKGLVQEQYDLSNNAALRLTIARYYTPIGRSIQRSYANGSAAYYEEIEGRIITDNSAKMDSLNNDTSKLFTTPSGKKLYGGGGIRPDYFVAADTSSLNDIMIKIFSKGTINHFAFQYFLENKNIFSRYKTAIEFANTFELNDVILQQFNQSMLEDSIDIKQIKKEDQLIINQTIKTAIARQIWDKQGYFETLNSNDETLKKALEIIK